MNFRSLNYLDRVPSKNKLKQVRLFWLRTFVGIAIYLTFHLSPILDWQSKSSIFRKVFRKVVVMRHRKTHEGERTENVGHHTNYGYNENSESDSEDDFQESVQRTQRI